MVPRLPELALLVVMAGCSRRAQTPALAVPQATALQIDGELDEPSWRQAARTGQFRDHGALQNPYSEARFLAGDGRLYVGMYAADQDIHKYESFLVTVTERLPSGDLALRAWAFQAGGDVIGPPGAVSRVDTDGTIDRSDDEDEEWVVEASLPVSSPHFDVSVRRCDTPKHDQERCGEWRGTLALPHGPPK